MAFQPITNPEIVTGAPIDTALLGKVQSNFNDHKTRLDTVGTRLDTNDSINEDQNDFISFSGCSSINKNKFIQSIAVNTGALPSYIAAAPNKTGTGVLRSNAASQVISYNNFIPVNSMLGVGGVLTFLAASNTTLTFGISCFDLNKTLISTKNFADPALGTGSFQKIQRHLVDEGAAAGNLPVGTRYVKPFISFTGNTGNVDIDFLGVFPMLFASYALFQ